MENEECILHSSFSISPAVLFEDNHCLAVAKPAALLTQAPKDGDKKDKKPFHDRVLEKALDHLRGEIKKIGALPVAPEVFPS